VPEFFCGGQNLVGWYKAQAQAELFGCGNQARFILLEICRSQNANLAYPCMNLAQSLPDCLRNIFAFGASPAADSDYQVFRRFRSGGYNGIRSNTIGDAKCQVIGAAFMPA
jgi:hypothetical protein